jgi:hypothetical protein
MFLKNCWYLAAWEPELPEHAPIALSVPGADTIAGKARCVSIQYTSKTTESGSGWAIRSALIPLWSRKLLG